MHVHFHMVHKVSFARKLFFTLVAIASNCQISVLKILLTYMFIVHFVHMVPQGIVSYRNGSVSWGSNTCWRKLCCRRGIFVLCLIWSFILCSLGRQRFKSEEWRESDGGNVNFFMCVLNFRDYGIMKLQWLQLCFSLKQLSSCFKVQKSRQVSVIWTVSGAMLQPVLLVCTLFTKSFIFSCF